MLGSPILYLKGMRAIMFQLSGFFYKAPHPESPLKHGRSERLYGHETLFCIQGLRFRALRFHKG